MLQAACHCTSWGMYTSIYSIQVNLFDTEIMQQLCTLQAMFNHVGTTQEYLYHFCRNKVLFNSYLLEIEKVVNDVDEVPEDNNELTQSDAKRSKISSYENCIVMHSVLHTRSR